MSEFDPKKYKQIAKFFSKTEKRYINAIVYSYDGSDPKISLSPSTKNSNPNAEANKQWIKGNGISGITKEEAQALVIALQAAISKLP